MDPLTQGLLGAAASQALFGKHLGGNAWLIGAVGGVLPDADVFIRSESDPLLEVVYHRGFTHALAFVPVGGVVAGLPWLTRRKYREQWKIVLGAATAGYATHGLLDACTTYGTQLYWPFSTARAAWDCISIVDPLFTLVLLAGVLWGAFTRRRGPAAVALALCLVYLGVGALQHDRALAAQKQIAVSRGHAVQRQAAFPTIGNLVVWRSLYEASGTYYADRIRVPILGGVPRWTPGSKVDKVTESDLSENLRSDEGIIRDFRRFSWFSGGWVARSPTDSAVIGDARYSLRTESFDPVWGVRFDPDVRPQTEWVNRTEAREMRLREFWREIAGEDAEYRPLPN